MSNEFPHITKFHGKFKDLIPAGFKFQKLFANNYRQYCISEDGRGYGDQIRVWQHHGGYVEINDLHEYSKLIFEVFSIPEQLEKYKVTYNNPIFGKKSYYVFMLNKKTNKLEILDKNSPNYEFYPIRKLKDNEITESQSDEMLNEYFDTYRKILIYDNCWLSNYIKHMINVGWVKP